MRYDTAGNQIYEIVAGCSCGLTGGCRLCNFYLEKYSQISFSDKRYWNVLDEIPITDEEYDYYEKLPPLKEKE